MTTQVQQRFSLFTGDDWYTITARDENEAYRKAIAFFTRMNGGDVASAVGFFATCCSWEQNGVRGSEITDEAIVGDLPDESVIICGY